MARASWYDFESPPYCCFCGKSTEEEIVVRHHNCDLAYDTVSVRAHRWCRLWRVAGCFLVSGATVVATSILLALAEAGAWYDSFGRWSTLPLLAKIFDVTIGVWLGAYVGILLGRLYYRKVDEYVRLNTLPYP
jgi:hypothetical protein